MIKAVTSNDEKRNNFLRKRVAVKHIAMEIRQRRHSGWPCHSGVNNLKLRGKDAIQREDKICSEEGPERDEERDYSCSLPRSISLLQWNRNARDSLRNSSC